mmetsp:Transcript_41347/g.128848  ORF Transcript_41347/g.128848 Transcript_41347/m.128848 type:complete len:540 (+) Transcript_41347:190-1809(+)
MGDANKSALTLADTGSAIATRGNATLQTLQQQKVLDTPRTREACRRLGLVLEDLQFRTQDSFANPGDLKEKVQLRFEHFEKRRKERLGQVLAERAKVIAQHAKKGEVPGVQSGQFLSMLESLFEKEAKRLESDLKGQLRQHSALVKDNEDQLRKESQLQQRETVRQLRRAASLQHFAEAGSKTRQKVESRLAHNAEAVAKMEHELREKQVARTKQLLAEEERLERFYSEKAALITDRAAAVREKLDKTKERHEHMEIEKRQEAETRFHELEQKFAQLQSRREEDLRRKQMQSEEQHLHLLDVREQKSRIERVDSNRRGELREHMEHDHERIETLLALKDQLLVQRRGRNTKAEAAKGARGCNLKRDFLPGPGQYEAPRSTLADVPTMKIGKAKVTGIVEDAVKGTLMNPAPGSYMTSLMPNGDRVDKASLSGGKFRARDRDTYLDDAVKAKGHLPPPGCYEAKAQLNPNGPAMRRDYVDTLSKGKSDKKQLPAWAGPRRDGPGPAGYCVDDYMRKEAYRRAQRSLPNLARDMLGTAVVA